MIEIREEPGNGPAMYLNPLHIVRVEERHPNTYTIFMSDGRQHRVGAAEGLAVVNELKRQR